MECLMTGNVRYFSDNLRRPELGDISFVPFNVPFGKSLTGIRSIAFPHCGAENSVSISYPKCKLYWRKRQASISLDPDISLEGDQTSREGDLIPNETSENLSSKLLGQDELKLLLMDSERTRLVKKLSEANQYNRYLKRQLQNKDADLVDLKSDLAMLELDLEALVGLAKEVANSGVFPGTRKLNGKYIQSHLVSRLVAACVKLKQHIRGVDLIKFQEITLHWVGMAESVQVMGSFDGWSEGEDMSPDYDGTFPRFSATLKLRSGRYEIKFLVDGQWQLSPELPTVGEGLLKNNLLIV